MRNHKGFTLVELVVVVMILGILAAVAAPKLLGTSAAAADNGLKQTLTVIRDAIERYAAEHGGQLPGQAGTDAGMKTDLEKYLRGGIPKCPVPPLNNQILWSTDDPLEGEANPTKAWAYNKTTGQFICNSAATTQSDQDDPALTYDKL